ncbi:peptidoglycan-binding domain-containing protein [Nodularia sp. UHCC 0506]|uniref:peptidoglycan-binding domain-containing protein n=1 Tax=Nodularia sp. UHCC 0506 TaxID=3110243 RepID=UPI002B21B80E|nr:peptidoglycan-binding domain-containing protein [Nodularia sp. UHCC 0506]MEA5512831.1 peptidoglycan-binding domain-containing protein [Nodularia sp. UHCC 0506]
MMMSEISLLMTGILTAKRLSLPNKLPQPQPLARGNSWENLTQNNLTQLVANPEITPPEFIETDKTNFQTSSASYLAKDKLFEKITKRYLSPGLLVLAKNYNAPVTINHSIKIAARSPRFSGPPLPILRFGNSGTSVRILQRLLVANGYAIRVDGAFGPLTETAVKAFQNQRSIGVDGVVGPVTWQHLSI